MGRSVVVGGSTGDGQIGSGRISDGESVVVPISVLICFCLCFSVLVVDSAAVVVFFFFFFFLVIVAATIFLVVVVVVVVVAVVDDDDGGGIQYIILMWCKYYFNI